MVEMCHLRNARKFDVFELVERDRTSQVIAGGTACIPETRRTLVMLRVLMVSILEHISQLYTMVSGAPLNDTFQPYMLSI